MLLPLLEEERAHPLLGVRAGIDECLVRLDRTLEDAEEVDPAGERVGDRLEHESGRVGAVDVGDRARLGRRGDALDNQVEQGVRAEVLGRDPARDREDLTTGDRILQCVRHLLHAELLAFQVLLHQRLVRLDDLVEQLLAVLGHETRHLLRDRTGLGLLGAVGTRVRAHVEDVDDAGHLVLGADRKVHGDAALGELLLQLAECAEEVRPFTVEHVDEEQARDPELLRALPDARRADLDAHHAAEDEEGAFDHPERGTGFALKARIARDVDQVQLAFVPLRVRERQGDRHLPLLLVVVPVGGRRARVDRAEPVRLTGLEEQCLDQRRLARPAMADDGDVADPARLENGHTQLPPRLTGFGLES